MTTTIKTVTDCDYLVYLDKDMKVAGFELTMDERQALSLKYRAKEELCPTIPEDTIYILEVYGISSTLVWLMSKDNERGELLFYKPSLIELSKEIEKYSNTAIPLEEYGSHPSPDGKIKYLPAVVDTSKVISNPGEEILKKIPYTNWMEDCWHTPAWIIIWKARPELQRFMTEFVSMKARQGEIL